jgi:hypothetical protein
MYILFLPRVGLYISFLALAYARGKTSWHKGLLVVKTIYTYGFHELFLKQTWLPQAILVSDWSISKNVLLWNRFAKWTETW